MSDTYDDADIYYFFDFDYYLRDRRDTHLLDGNLMRKIEDDRIKWMMARKQEKNHV